MRQTIAYATLLGSLLFQQVSSAPLRGYMIPDRKFQETQKESTKILKSMLQELETKYKVSFMYKSELINETLKVPVCRNCTSIESELGYMLKRSSFKYEKIGTNFYVITPKNQIKERPAEKQVGSLNSVQQKPEFSINLINQKTIFTETAASAQVDFQVSGTVKDSEGNPLANVTVRLKGSSIGTSTNKEGSYTISVPETNAVLLFSSVGFITLEMEVNRQLRVDVNLVKDNKSLDDVVVVGYGAQTKRAVTGSISSIKSSTISKNINADPTTALQGTVSGVQITQQGGTPGGAIRVRVRGTASMLSGANPLVIIDGFPAITTAFGTNSADGISGLSQINPEDIESIEVLKDAAASAIYGSRAANGVILVTTKKGKAGQSSFSVNFNKGITSATNRVKLLNGQDYLDVVQKAADNRLNSGLAPIALNLIPQFVNNLAGYNVGIARQTNTNWMDQVLQDGMYDDISISASTGTEKTQLYASGSYRKETGIEIGRDFTRASGRLSAQHSALGNMFTLGVNMSMNYIENENNGSQFATAQSRALPIYPIFAPNGTGYFNNGFVPLSTVAGTNTVFTRINTENMTKTFRNNAIAFVEAKPLKGLALRSEWGYDMQSTNDDALLRPDIFPAEARNNPSARGGGNGQTATRRFSSLAWNTNNTITYNRVFATDHRVTLLGGASLLNQRNTGRTYVFDGIPILSLDIAGSNFAVQSPSESLFRFASIFSRINYSYKDKYLLEGSVRQDGSSRFGPGKRVGTFGGGSMGWILSEEDFFRDRVGLMNFLKLRVSYGVIGNAELPGDFSYISLASSTDSESSHGGFSGLSFNTIGNQNLSWESTAESNIGLDFEVLKGRIRTSVEYYNKESRDLLLGSRLANSTGYLNRDYTFNVGSLRNRGFEIEINTKNIIKGDFTWTSNFNISNNKATVLTLQPLAPGVTRINAVDGGSNRLVEGGAFGAYFLPIYAGVDTKTGNELIYEVDQPYLSQTGIARLTGNVLDGTLTNNLNNHRMVIQDKTPLPKYYGGLSNTFSYKGIELTALFYFQYGNYILDEGERSQSYPGEQQSLRESVKNALTDNTIPLTYNSGLPIAGTNTTRFLHDGSFIRLRNLQIGYAIPAQLSKRYGIKNMRLFVSGQNLLTFTKFPGWDPEVFTTGGDVQRSNIGPGNTSYNLPQVRTLLAGININF